MLALQQTVGDDIWLTGARNHPIKIANRVDHVVSEARHTDGRGKY